MQTLVQQVRCRIQTGFSDRTKWRTGRRCAAILRHNILGMRAMCPNHAEITVVDFRGKPGHEKGLQSNFACLLKERNLKWRNNKLIFNSIYLFFALSENNVIVQGVTVTTKPL